MRFTVLALVLVTTVGCGDDDGTVTPDAPQTSVSGCDDPAVWTVPALVATTTEVYLGGGECSQPQLPLHRASVRWEEDYELHAEQHNVVDRVCWRVSEASPGSGWTVGEIASADGYFWSSFNVIGFTRSVTFEGRGLFPNGIVAYSMAPTTIELAPPMILEPDAASVTVVMGRYGWAEHDAVHVWGQRVPTDEVLGGASVISVDREIAEATLHQIGTNIVLRTWTHETSQIEYTDFVVGPGTRAQITSSGNAVLVDGTKLVLFERTTTGGLIVRRQVTLPAEPLAIVEETGSVLVHLPGTLMRVSAFEQTPETLAVGNGVLIPSPRYATAYFFDGTTFRRIEPTFSPLALDPVGVSPMTHDLARLGKPVAVVDGTIIGENGLVAVNLYDGAIVPGPASVSYAEVFGDGHLGPFSVNTATYVIEHDDGSAVLYQAPYTPYSADVCQVI